MRFTELSATEFQDSMALLGEAFENLASADLGESLLRDIQAGAGKQKDSDSAISWAFGLLSKYLPRIFKDHVEDAYRILAACDGQSLDEYEKGFTPTKFVSDCKAFKGALAEDGELRGMFTGFLS